MMRHFAIDTFYDGLIYGHCDVALRQPITANRDDYHIYLKNCDRIFISPMQRCHQTYEFLLSTVDYHQINDLREQNFGWLEQQKWSDIEKNHPEFYHDFWQDVVNHPITDGEAVKIFFHRVAKALHDIKNICIEKAYKNILIISHAGTMRAAHAYFAAQEKKQEELSEKHILQAIEHHWKYGEIITHHWKIL